MTDEQAAHLLLRAVELGVVPPGLARPHLQPLIDRMLPRQFAEPAAPTRFVEIVGVTTGARDVPLTLAHHSAVFSLPVGAKVRVLDPLGEPRHIEDFVTVVGRDIDGGWVSVRGVTCVALGDRLEFTPWSEK